MMGVKIELVEALQGMDAAILEVLDMSNKPTRPLSILELASKYSGGNDFMPFMNYLREYWSTNH